LNDVRPITEADLWSLVGDHLSRQPRKDLASAMIERVRDLRHGSMRRWQRHEVQRAHGDRLGMRPQAPRQQAMRTRMQRLVEPVAETLRHGRDVALRAVARTREVLRPRPAPMQQQAPEAPTQEAPAQERGPRRDRGPTLSM
jgi:hypothetical protein